MSNESTVNVTLTEGELALLETKCKRKALEKEEADAKKKIAVEKDVADKKRQAEECRSEAIAQNVNASKFCDELNNVATTLNKHPVYTIVKNPCRQVFEAYTHEDKREDGSTDYKKKTVHASFPVDYNNWQIVRTGFPNNISVAERIVDTNNEYSYRSHNESRGWQMKIVENYKDYWCKNAKTMHEHLQAKVDLAKVQDDTVKRERDLLQKALEYANKKYPEAATREKVEETIYHRDFRGRNSGPYVSRWVKVTFENGLVLSVTASPSAKAEAGLKEGPVSYSAFVEDYSALDLTAAILILIDCKRKEASCDQSI